MAKNRVVATLIFVLVIAGLSVYLANPYGAKLFGKNFTYKLGLDLQGGTQLVYEANLSTVDPDAADDAMSGLRDVIERRVNAFGVGEPVVQVSGENRLLVELPGITDIDEAVSLIGETPLLEFREENPDFVAPEDPEALDDIDPYEVFRPTLLTGSHLRRAEVTFSGQSSAISEPQILLNFNAEGTRLFEEITRANLGRRVAIFLDGQLVVAPVVQSVITAGEAVITGQYTINEARETVTRLNSGALPVSISLLSQQNIGPSLGLASVNRSLVAGVIGLLSVMLFLAVYYRLPGVLSALALLFYAVLALSIFKILNITMTLASIAGFILSIGMAIDANILIFERTKEELRKGKDLASAIETGFERAWPSIHDSNISSLITAAVLFLGTSFVRGFAITLALGTVISMFTAITMTRTFLRLLVIFNKAKNPKLFGVETN